MNEAEIKPNDVMIVFRPVDFSDGEWNGNYSIFVSAAGPLTLSGDDVGKLISSAMMVAVCANFLEDDEELANKAAKRCEEIFGDMDDAVVVPVQLELFDDEYQLDEDSPTVGGTQ
jgi:hypothetical protein